MKTGCYTTDLFDTGWAGALLAHRTENPPYWMYPNDRRSSNN